MNGTEAIGWASSVILLLTLTKQVYKQWREDSSSGISKWLYAGQVAASVGFTTYSWLVDNTVFVITNALILCSTLAGLFIYWRHRRRDRARPSRMETRRAA